MKLYDDAFIIKAIRNEYSYNLNVTPKFYEKILIKIINIFSYFGFVFIFIASRIPILSSLLESFSRVYSRNSIGFFLRGAYYKSKLKRMGKNVIIDLGAIISNPENVKIGDNTHIDTYTKIEGGSTGGFVKIGKYCHLANGAHIQGGGGLIIGNYVGIASNVRIYSSSNHYQDPLNPNKFIVTSSVVPLNQQHIIKKLVKIGDFSFIGINVIILPGIEIGEGAVIGAGSVVTKNIPPYCIAVGIPAKIIKKRPERVH